MVIYTLLWKIEQEPWNCWNLSAAAGKRNHEKWINTHKRWWGGQSAIEYQDSNQQCLSFGWSANSRQICYPAGQVECCLALVFGYYTCMLIHNPYAHSRLVAIYCFCGMLCTPWVPAPFPTSLIICMHTPTQKPCLPTRPQACWGEDNRGIKF